jgi:hypothetical protein
LLLINKNETRSLEFGAYAMQEQCKIGFEINHSRSIKVFSISLSLLFWELFFIADFDI